MQKFNFFLAALLALPVLVFPANALADSFRVDLILFMNEGGSGRESPLPWQAPDLNKTLQASETARLRAAGIEILPDGDFGLVTQWQRLKNSRRHRPLMRLAWVQKDPPAERGVSLRLRSGDPYKVLSAAGTAGVYPVDGSVALLMGRYLHLDADLVHTRDIGAGELGSLRLRERRRLRRAELHYLDSPALGLLVRVERAP